MKQAIQFGVTATLGIVWIIVWGGYALLFLGFSGDSGSITDIDRAAAFVPCFFPVLLFCAFAVKARREAAIGILAIADMALLIFAVDCNHMGEWLLSCAACVLIPIGVVANWRIWNGKRG
jgi:hypothetical protein